MRIPLGESPLPGDNSLATETMAGAGMSNRVKCQQGVLNLKEGLYKTCDEATAWFSNPEHKRPHLNSFRGPCLVAKVKSGFSDAGICQLVSSLLFQDDVTCQSFCRFLVLVHVPKIEQDHKVYLPLSEYPNLRDLGFDTIVMVQDDDKLHHAEDLCSGPYVFTDNSFYQVYKLYPDSQAAFFSSITYDTRTRTFNEIRPTTHIAVPSRLYSGPKTSARPLAGLRFATKDLVNIAGLKTSVGSRSYYELSSECDSSAQLIIHLMGLGAVLLGKTKNTQFANGEDPQEWIDFDCPWNPRGDGYQNPDTSSTGSATAVSSYEWIDFAIGSDTCGSIACPAAAQGLFAIRFSRDAVSREGVFQINQHLDSVGLFTRSADQLCLIATSWVNVTKHQAQVCQDAPSPLSIVYPRSSFSHQNQETLDTHDQFVNTLVHFTRAEKNELDIDKQWKMLDPLGSGLSIYDDLKKTTAHLHLAGFADTVEPFRKAFRKRMHKEPYLDRVNTEKLRLASHELTPESRHEMVENMKHFTQFVQKQLVPHTQTDARSLDTIMVWAFNPQEPQYRDNYPPLSAHVNWRWDVDYTAPLAGLPQVIVPIGQFEYHSRITGELDYLPICASVVASAGNDLALLRFISEFLKVSQGWPSSVKTGRYIV